MAPTATITAAPTSSPEGTAISLGSTVAYFPWQVDLAASTSLTFTVGIIVGGFYTRDNSSDDAVITVSKAVVTNEVAGDGWFINRNSAGPYAGDAGQRTDLVFQAKYDKRTDSLRGSFRMTIRSGGRVYEIRSSEIISLAVSSNKTQSSVIFRAVLLDVTDSKKPVTIADHLSLVVSMTTGKKPAAKSIGITLWRGGELLFSSSWSGTKTIEQSLDGGSIAVRS